MYYTKYSNLWWTGFISCNWGTALMIISFVSSLSSVNSGSNGPATRRTRVALLRFSLLQSLCAQCTIHPYCVKTAYQSMKVCLH